MKSSIQEDCPHLRPQQQEAGPQVTRTSVQLGYRSGVTKSPSSSSIMCDNSSQHSGKHYFLFKKIELISYTSFMAAFLTDQPKQKSFMISSCTNQFCSQTSVVFAYLQNRALVVLPGTSQDSLYLHIRWRSYKVKFGKVSKVLLFKKAYLV